MVDRSYSLVANDASERRCFQACFRMVIEAFSGNPISEAEADRLTRFDSSRLSWPLAGMAALAHRGLHVALLEDFDPRRFVRDPMSELERQYGSRDQAEGAAAEIDLDAEVANVRMCLSEPTLNFISRRPTINDIEVSLQTSETLAIAHCNYREIVGREGYVPHYVLAKRWRDDAVVIDDPGLPAERDYVVQHHRFASAARLDNGANGSVVFVSTYTLPPSLLSTRA